jgi:hypothetical protein
MQLCRSPDRLNTLAPCGALSVRMRILAALGAFPFSRYRLAKYSGEKAPVFAVELPADTARGTQFWAQIFSD